MRKNATKTFSSRRRKKILDKFYLSHAYLIFDYLKITAMANYDLQFFKDFFGSIPDEKWCIQSLENPSGQRCALGHLMGRHMNFVGSYHMSEEVDSLVSILRRSTTVGPAVDDSSDYAVVFRINDAPVPIKEFKSQYGSKNLDKSQILINEETPKARIMRALSMVEQEQEAMKPVEKVIDHLKNMKTSDGSVSNHSAPATVNNPTKQHTHKS